MNGWIKGIKARTEGGSTLIELLVVLIILGVLAGMALLQPATREARDRARLARLHSETRLLLQAQLLYRTEHDTYYFGPFNAAAARAAGFEYSLPPDFNLAVHSIDPRQRQWNATLALHPPGAANTEGAPACELALDTDEGARTQCRLWPNREIRLPGAKNGTAPLPLDPLNQ